jgi:FAD/FMN-containing dehydrogenase
VILKPQSREELAAQLARNFAAAARVEAVDLSALAAVSEHHPEDMTASVESGMTIAAFQENLRKFGQWLPIDPPHAEKLRIGDLLALNLSGSRRLGYGTIRDYLIGLKVVLADGTMIKTGGKVVKNVAGYDLCKLFIGAKHSLGVIVEGTFKLRPLPEAEIFVERETGSFDELEEVRRELIERTEPVLFDAANIGGALKLWAAFAGNSEDVAAQVEIATRDGFRRSETVEYAREFWNGSAPAKTSVLPSKIVGVLKDLGAEEWLAHLGNGVLYFRGWKHQEPTRPDGDSITKILMDRVKKAYDPKLILPNYA